MRVASKRPPPMVEVVTIAHRLYKVFLMRPEFLGTITRLGHQEWATAKGDRNYLFKNSKEASNFLAGEWGVDLNAVSDPDSKKPEPRISINTTDKEKVYEVCYIKPIELGTIRKLSDQHWQTPEGYKFTTKKDATSHIMEKFGEVALDAVDFQKIEKN